MKYLFTISILFIFVSISFSQNKVEGVYKIIDIDTLSEHYIINAINEKDSVRVVVISFKDDVDCTNKILIEKNKVYYLSLQNYLEIINVTPSMLAGGFTLKFGDKVIWDKSKNFYPYKALNIKGIFLCE